jgi:CheY-like chemotaxis protein
MPKTIIWIEDDTDIIDPVVRPLELAGHRFVRLRTATEALNAVQQIREADLILLDMILRPGQTKQEFGRYPGLDVLRELRKVQGVTTPVVALTVVTREEVLHQLKELDVADIVRKPVRPSELKERVERVLESQG